MSESQRISQSVVKQIKELSGKGLSARAVARQLGIYHLTVLRYRDEPDRLITEQKPSPKELANRQIDDYAEFHKEKFEHGLERMRKWIGDTAPAIRPKCSKGRQNAPKTISLVINDLHAPFLDEQAFGKAIREGKAVGATECIVPGDLMDFYAVSRYPKTRKKYSLVEEFQSARATVRMLSENFERVRLQEGNHDQRWIKFLVASGMPPDVLDFMKLEYRNSLCPLAKLADDFPNVEMLEVPECGNARYPHIAQVGDCIFSHSEKYSIIPNKAANDVLLFLKKKLEPMGIIKPFRILIQAHTHAAGKTWGDFGVVTMENGTLSQTPDYDGNSKLMGRQPVLGYTLLVQRNGITDINATNFHAIS